MKRKIFLMICCVAVSVLVSGCQLASQLYKRETESVAVTEQITENVTENITEKVTDKKADGEHVEQNSAVGLGAVSETAFTEEAVLETVVTETPVTETLVTEMAISEAAVMEEEYLQCPYCAHWFNSVEDGSGSPYHRHLEEERATDSAHGLTESELAECPDCGNWYPVGNIFRNHICEGRI